MSNKVRVTFKTPDVVDNALFWEFRDNWEARDEWMAFIRNFVQYDEYVTIEFDKEAGTATVVRVS